MNYFWNLVFKCLAIAFAMAFNLNAQSHPANNLNPNKLSEKELQTVLKESFIIHSFQAGGDSNEGKARFGCFTPNHDNLFSQDSAAIIDHYVKVQKFAKPIFFISVGFGFRESPASLSKLEAHQRALRRNEKWLASDAKLASELCKLAEQKGITIWISRGDGSWEKSTELVSQLKHKN